MRKYLYTVFCMLYAAALFAANPGFGDRRYTISGAIEYGYNKTWLHYANFDIQGLMPINPYFEMEAKLQFSTANVHSGALQVRPKFELPVGEIFLETDLYFRAVTRNQLTDYTAAFGAGYRMDYISFMIGSYTRILDDWNRNWHSTDNYVVEPFNLLYRLEVFCRPQNNNWNLSFVFTDIDDYQMERMWQPLFAIKAYYDVVEHWRLNFGVQCKPTGMFHLDATFYGANLRAGFSYRF